MQSFFTPNKLSTSNVYGHKTLFFLINVNKDNLQKNDTEMLCRINAKLTGSSLVMLR